MTLTLHYHPLASFCWKAQIALYESGAAFTPHLVDLGDAAAAGALRALSPLGKFPVLEDGRRVIAESSIIVEHLDLHHGGRLIPREPEQALEARYMDRLFDLYIHEPMQKIVLDRLRPKEAKDHVGVAAARAQLEVAYAAAEARLRGRAWAGGEAFTIADCAAAPALYYAGRIAPLSAGLAHYLQRLEARPSFARVLEEAAPYLAHWPPPER